MIMTRAAIGRASSRARESLARGAARFRPFQRFRATRLLIAPHDLRTSDPTVANDIYAGYFAFAGRSVATNGASPFDLAAPSRGWAEALYGFIWLRHMRAANTAITRANARDLVDDFITGKRDRDPVAARPGVLARRLISFLSHSPLLLEGADHDFYDRFIQHCGRSISELNFALLGPTSGLERLQAILAMALASLCLDGLDHFAGRAERLLADELDRQILADGGHVSRNPRVLAEVLLDLLPLREAYAGRGMEAPRALLTAIDRMMPHLRMFRHGDGSLALFNGMGVTLPDVMATLIAYDDARSRPMEHAPYAGYDRMEAGMTVVVADVGLPPPRPLSGEACAGCLSFQLSSGLQTIVVNCGTPRHASESLTLLARSTAAHSTVTVADTSSARFGVFAGERRIVSGPRSVPVRRDTRLGAFELVASHDGYKRQFGLVHERSWTLRMDGEQLDGEDRFTLSGSRGPVPVVLRFHLHPAIRASLIQDGAGALLMTGPGEAWVFEASGQQVSIEDSIFFASSDSSRRTSQLVVEADAVATGQIGWRFSRLGQQQRDAAPPQAGNHS
jgi:uncharacterized heparinase superfamily protein